MGGIHESLQVSRTAPGNHTVRVALPYAPEPRGADLLLPAHSGADGSGVGGGHGGPLRAGAHLLRDGGPDHRLPRGAQPAPPLGRLRHHRDAHGRPPRALRPGPGADRDALLFLRAPRDALHVRQPDGEHRRRGDGGAAPPGRLAPRAPERLQLRRAVVGGAGARGFRGARDHRRLLHLARVLRQRDRPGAHRRGAHRDHSREAARHAAHPRQRRERPGHRQPGGAPVERVLARDRRMVRRARRRPEDCRLAGRPRRDVRGMAGARDGRRGRRHAAARGGARADAAPAEGRLGAPARSSTA